MSTIKKVANKSVCFTANVLAAGIIIVKDNANIINEACSLSLAGIITLKNASHRKLGGKDFEKRSFGDSYKAVHDLDHLRSKVYDGRASVIEYLYEVMEVTGVNDIINSDVDDILKAK